MEITSIEDFDYVSEDEVCPDSICENPRFKADLLTTALLDYETGEVYEIEAETMGAMAKAYEAEAAERALIDKIVHDLKQEELQTK